MIFRLLIPVRLLSGLTKLIRLRRQKKLEHWNIHMNYQMNKIHISGNIVVQTPTIPFVMNCPCFRTLPIHGNLLIWKRYSISQRSISPNMMMNHHFLRRLVFILLTIFWKFENLRYLDSSVPILITLPSKKLELKTHLRPDMNLSIRNTLEIRMTSIWENWENSIFNFKIKIFHTQKKSRLQQISFLNFFLWSRWWKRRR